MGGPCMPPVQRGARAAPGPIFNTREEGGGDDGGCDLSE